MLDIVLDKVRNMTNDLVHVGCFLFRQERFRAVISDESRGWSKSLACGTKIGAITYVGLYGLALKTSGELIDKETFLALFALLSVTSLITAMPIYWVIRAYAEPPPKMRVILETFMTAWTIFLGALLLITILGVEFVFLFFAKDLEGTYSGDVYFMLLVIGTSAFLICGVVVGCALYSHIKKLANCEGEISAIYIFLWCSGTYGLTALIQPQVEDFFVGAIKTLKSIL